MDLFDKISPRRAWIQRGLSALLVFGAFLCVYQPEFIIIKSWAKFAPQITIAYWLLGLAFLALRSPRLTMVAFVCCGFLCIFLKNTTNSALVKPTPTHEATLSIAQFNLSATNSGYGATVSSILKTDADIMTIQEVTPDWHHWLFDSMCVRYPFHCSVSMPNFTNIEVFTKFKIEKCDTIYSQNLPSLIIALRPTPTSRQTFLISTYIAPPLFTTAYQTMRQQLHDISQRIVQLNAPTITVGEYNLEGSSFEIQQFRQDAGLLDSRRGFQPMHDDGKIVLSEVPTDHFFYTPHFQCLDFQTISGAQAERLGIVGTYQFNQDSAYVAKTN